MNTEQVDGSEVNPSSCTPLSLTPEEVAQNKRCPVVLPALQRGAVWRSYQVEEVWDSLLRGFPIGSFLLTPVKGNERLGQRQLQNANPAESPEFYLLDGQQRWSAISLGFRNIWQCKADSSLDPVASSLWIDLEPFENRADGRLFAFRVVSRAHPWGFKRNNPRNRLEARQRRDALTAYEDAHSDINGIDFRPGKLPLQHAWPWDAKAPIPFPMLLQLVKAGVPPNQLWEKIEESLKSLPYWNDGGLLSAHGNWKDSVLKALRKPGSFQRKIIDGTRRILGASGGEPPYLISIQILLHELLVAEAEDNQPSQTAESVPDGIETLFVRVNSAGTPLEGEELRYSILKSAFPAVQTIVEQLGTRLMSPARLVTIVSRLVLARTEREKGVPPGEPDVGRFRRLVNDSKSSKFRDTVRWYLGIDEFGQPICDENGARASSRARDLLASARELLVNSERGLPNVLIADLARSTGGVEALFFLLAWLDRLLDAGLSATDICHDDRQRLVGAITTLGWFAERPFDCLTVLWARMDDAKHLDKFFSAGLLNLCAKSNEYNQLQLIPPVPPDCLSEAVQMHVLSAPGFNDPNGGDGSVWSMDWNLWDNFPASNQTTEFLGRYFDSEDNVKAVWQRLVERLWNMRSLIIYAQRENINKWFEDYDPAGPDQLEDTDRPWDFDHIHPANYGGVNSVPRLIKAWHNSIGNLRAWPLELNRSQGDFAPGLKLSAPNSREKEPPYLLNEGEEIRFASFISETSWPNWLASTPDGRDPPRHNYLVYPTEANYGPC